MEGELLDWELVHDSDAESIDSITSSNKSGSSTAIDDGMILSDHFSADNLIKIPGVTADQSQDEVVGSGDSFPVSESPNQRQNRGEVLVDMDFHQSGDACVRNELGFYDPKTGISGDGDVRLSDFEPSDEKHVASEAVPESTDGKHAESQSGVEEPIEESSKCLSDSGGNESGLVDGEEEIVSDSGVVSTESIVGSGGSPVEVVGDVNSAVRSGDEGKSRETVWWKMPFVLLKYCTFRIGPVWSVSMAAAVMGLALLGRRLYNMKKKAQRFNLKVTIDDKKVARVMSQAARLNEVFTEVRRVPVIHPALPSPGAWPVLSLR